MTSKAYIVANEQQEREVLEQLEKEGFMWTDHANKPTELVPSIEVSKQFPYAIVIDRNISLKLSNYFEHYEIVYDGRKEEHVSDKYVVSQKFMNKLNEWKDTLDSNDDEYKPLVSWVNIKNIPETVYMWLGDDVPDKENNNRLIAIIRWVNGEDVFEVEKPKKWVVRSKETDDGGHYGYGKLLLANNNTIFMGYSRAKATFFDTKEEAESWANSHQEVVEVEE